MKRFVSGRYGVFIAAVMMALNVWLMLMPEGAFAKGKPITGPRVIDANNKLVGPIVGFFNTYSNPAVALKISTPDMVMVVEVHPNDFGGNMWLSFTMADCSGQPYMRNDDLSRPHLLPLVAVRNNIVYGPRPNSAPDTVTIYSQLQDSGWCSVNPFGSSETVVIADPIVDLSTEFTPPYRFVYP